MAFSSIDVKRQSWNINCEWALWIYVIQDQIFGILWGVSNNIDSLNIPKCHYDYCKITEAVIKMRGYFVAFNSILLLRKREGRDNKERFMPFLCLSATDGRQVSNNFRNENEKRRRQEVEIANKPAFEVDGCQETCDDKNFIFVTLDLLFSSNLSG